MSVDIDLSDGKKVACGTMDNKVLIFEINKEKFGSFKGKGTKSFSKDKPLHEL